MASNELEGNPIVEYNQSRKFRYLRIASNERTNGDPYNFLAQFGNDIRLDHTVAMSLQSITFPNIADNVSSAIGNDQLLLDFTTAGIVPVSFAAGYYSTAQIIALITAAVNPIITPSVLTITQDAISNKLVFVVTGGDTLTFMTAAQGSTLSPTLGILAQAGPAGGLTATALPNLRGATVLFVHSYELGGNVTYRMTPGSDVEDVNGILTVPIDVPYGAMQVYKPTDEDILIFGRIGTSTRNFQIVMRVDNGRLYTELTDNQPFILTFKVFTTRSQG